VCNSARCHDRELSRRLSWPFHLWVHVQLLPTNLTSFSTAVVYRLGGENLAVAQNTYAVSWFKGRELNMVVGLQLSVSRIGSTVNMITMAVCVVFCRLSLLQRHSARVVRLSS
jgi:hypothetical protein